MHQAGCSKNLYKEFLPGRCLRPFLWDLNQEHLDNSVQEIFHHMQRSIFEIFTSCCRLQKEEPIRNTDPHLSGSSRLSTLGLWWLTTPPRSTEKNTKHQGAGRRQGGRRQCFKAWSGNSALTCGVPHAQASDYNAHNWRSGWPRKYHIKQFRSPPPIWSQILPDGAY